ncbi:hypothetical protein CHLRE_02g086000v5 [Chlamydomonas reinhardtii]|uniref:Sulfatase N-terminal domain-containing protein n=1 Tax=Chlamydomonas reinhardtii TaxID=3055 RepID=A0A2K3E0X7_CHLRE|nr:uncharacterized protein CHLRE_02g086000v5 [Chlamydomonas reinhardtii]PNW86425.1 hypothetical protein CHLRE_02g086000v5 [Chlamydomonas reinhardtii]
MSTIRKNILLILTDDQDYLLGSADAKYMPTLDKYLRKQGLELPQFIVAGCPSRASLLTGRHCHNTNITSNSAARGGAFQFLERGLDSDYLPVWLQAAGYNTYLVGQFLNGFNRSVLQQYGCPQGWTAADVLVQADESSDGGSADGAGSGDGSGQDVPAYGCAGPDGVVTYTGRYHEELIREKVTKRIDEAAGQDQPFFMMVATVAPRDSGRAATAYPEVMPEYKNLFLGERAPRLADWGVPVPAEVGFTSQRTNNFNAADIDARFRARLQALRAVDDTLALMLSRLACHDLLDDTVIVFSSDSGFKLGSHNMAQDKSTYFEEDVRVPMLLAGPGMPVGVYAAEVTAAAVDLTATITYLAGIMSEPGSTTLDGAPLPLDAIAAAYPQPNQPRASASAARERPVCDSPFPHRPRSPPPPSPRPPGGRPRPPPPPSPRPPLPLRVDPPPPQASVPLPPRPRLRPWTPPSPQPPGQPDSPQRRPSLPPPSATREPALARATRTATATSALTASPFASVTTCSAAARWLAPTATTSPATCPDPQSEPAVASPARPADVAATTAALAGDPQATDSTPAIPKNQAAGCARLAATTAATTAAFAAHKPRTRACVSQSTDPRRTDTATGPTGARIALPSSRSSTGHAEPTAPTPSATSTAISSSTLPAFTAAGCAAARPATADSAAIPAQSAYAAATTAPLAAAPQTCGIGPIAINDAQPKPTTPANSQPSCAQSSTTASPQPPPTPAESAFTVTAEPEPAATQPCTSRVPSFAAAASTSGVQATRATRTRRPPRPPPPPPPVNLTASVEQQNSTAESGRRLLAQVLGLGEGEWAAEEAGRRARLQQQQQAAQGSAREPLPYYGMWSNVRTLESWLDMATPSRASKSFRAVRACSSFMGYGPPVLVPRAGNTTCFKYIVFCNPANVDSLGTIRMLFDLGRDPTELVNLYKQPLDGLALRLVDRLDALLSVTAYCEGGLCRNPFRAIHIDGSINNLYQAMDPTFDLLYASFDKFSYRRCAPYYHPENEKADKRLVPTHIRKWVAKT